MAVAAPAERLDVEPILAKLDPEQRAAATLSDGPAQIIAPAGSGKTTTMVARLAVLLARGVIPQRRPFVLFVLGRYASEAEARPPDLLPYLAAHDADCPWALCAFGRREAACVLTAAGLGGHARVGFENNLWLTDGRLAASNAELVQRRTDLERARLGVDYQRSLRWPEVAVRASTDRQPDNARHANTARDGKRDDTGPDFIEQ